MTNRSDDDDQAPEVQLRTLRILWAAHLICVGLFTLIARFGPDRDETVGDVEGVPPLLYVLAAAALSAFVASFFVKASFFRQAAGRQRPLLVQQGLIIALALCESAALFGLTGMFATQCDYSYLLMALGALGILLHFPRREQLMAAYYRPAV